jgi:adenine-specific DNA-methyltransferase
MLRAVGIETTNLYTAFIALAVRNLVDGGELVSINPRSFCNGPYFKPFRREFLDLMALDRIHVFESRKTAFSGDEVLQENVILHAIKSHENSETVTISATIGNDDELTRAVNYGRVVQPTDPDLFIHIVIDDEGDQVRERLSHFQAALPDLDIKVSTGRVVDFRASDYLRIDPEPGTVPLIYPAHFKDGFVSWPVSGPRKRNAIVDSERTAELLVDEGVYVLTKRFSAKEERRRVVAAVYDSKRVRAPRIGFENHLNYYHRDGRGLPRNLAVGLAVFLNSTLVDRFFRQFNGHTQVNATDLRSFRYPSLNQLRFLASKIGDVLPDQAGIDTILDEVILGPGAHK